MRKRSGVMSVGQYYRRRRMTVACLSAALLLSFLGVVLSLDLFQTSADATMQLVRLNVNQDSGMVRIEITADGSFSDAVIEQSSRGRETLIRIRGARSLLRPSYTVDDQLARGVRIVPGERDGEPYVDVLISLGEGATLAQKKSFNRLVIGIAADFAQLRRRKPTDGAAELARRENKNPSVASAPLPAPHATAPVSEAVETSGASSVNNVAQAAVTQEAGTASLSSALPQASLRSRPLWSGLVGPRLRFDRSGDFNAAHGSPQTGSGAAVGQPAIFNFNLMAIDAPGADRGVWVPGTTTSTEDEFGGRKLGAGILRPSFLFGALFSDNYFYRSAIGRNMGIFALYPRIEFEVPGEARALRMAYEAKLRKLTNGKWANGQQFDFDMRADLSPSIRIGVRDHFVRSPLDTREYDPAGEVYIVGDTFNRNDFGARADFTFGQRNHLGLEAGSNIVRWSKSSIAGAPLFIDYDEIMAALSYERDMSEQTTALVAFTYTDANSLAPKRPQFNGLSNHRSYALETGLRTQFNETSGVSLRVGYERSDYRNAPSPNNFRGLIFNLSYRNDLTEKTNLQFAALRKTQVSAFNLEGGNARLVTTGGSVRLETAVTESLRIGLSPYYQHLGFPMGIVPNSTASGGVFVGNFAGERRTDHLYGFNVEGAYRMSELLRARLLYSFSRRDSTIPVFTFNTNRLSLIFELGRRNDVRGRSF